MPTPSTARPLVCACLRTYELISNSIMTAARKGKVGKDFSCFIRWHLDFEKLRAMGEVAVALRCDDDDILETDTAHAEIIQARLHGDHMAGS